MNNSQITISSSAGEWTAHDSRGRLLGRAGVATGFDGRPFAYNDAWTDEAFHRLADVLEEARPTLFTLVDAADTEQFANWSRHGFVESKRDVLYRISLRDNLIGRSTSIEVDRGAGDGEIVAMLDGAQVGRLELIPRRRGMTKIAEVHVDAEYRRRGVATALIISIGARLGEDAVHALVAEFDATNRAATRLAESLGAELVGTTVEMVRGRA